MKAHIQDYRARLEKEIAEYLALPASEKSARAVDGMLSCWEHIRSVERCLCGSEGHQNAPLSAADLTAWNSRMDNADGTRGGHWTISQTSGAAQSVGVAFEHITPEAWNTTMNMMYSDYYPTAEAYGTDQPEFYAQLAKDFLFDKDGGEPLKKLAEYYREIVKNA